MIADRKSMRSKGIAYIEFFEEASITPVSWTKTLAVHSTVSLPLLKSLPRSVTLGSSIRELR